MDSIKSYLPAPLVILLERVAQDYFGGDEVLLVFLCGFTTFVGLFLFWLMRYVRAENGKVQYAFQYKSSSSAPQHFVAKNDTDDETPSNMSTTASSFSSSDDEDAEEKENNEEPRVSSHSLPPMAHSNSSNSGSMRLRNGRCRKESNGARSTTAAHTMTMADVVAAAQRLSAHEHHDVRETWNEGW